MGTIMVRVLLVKPKFNNIFTMLPIIKTEPLEIEYMAAICKRHGVQFEICDETIRGYNLARQVEKFKPDLVAITANCVHIEPIKKYAHIIKGINPHIKVMVGGPHAEVKPEEFFFFGVDAVTYSGGFNAFENIIKNDKLIEFDDINGIYYFKDSRWIKNERDVFDVSKLPFPDRQHFYRHISEYRYISMKPCAILKASYSCPHKCNYCFATLLCNGKYTYREPYDVVEEIKSIDCENIWIVDDVFYVRREKLEEFIKLIKINDIKKNYALYYRADFIANNPDLMQKLSEIGVKMCSVGLEVIDDEVLGKYEKNSSVNLIIKAIEVLQNCKITPIALFMVDINAEKEYFKRLYKFIKTYDLSFSSIAILTPMPGTKQYELYENKLTTKDYKKWDFLHLVMKPGKMSRFSFYWRFYLLYLKLGLLNLKKIIRGKI